jgi:hypothetical protein
MIERYVTTSDRLIHTTMLNSNSELQIHLMSGEITKNVPADDATVGFSALFRQIFKGNEEASFDRVRNALSKAANEIGKTDACNVLKTWKRTHQTLRTRHLRSLMHDLARKAGLPTSDDDGSRIGAAQQLSPEKLIEAYLHGDMLHWGDGRDLLAEWAKTEHGEAEMEFQMRGDINTLAHFYLGFSDIARKFLPPTSIRPGARTY